MSVTILYYKLNQERISSIIQSEQITQWCEELPEIKQQQIKRLHKPDHQILSLVGLQLLKLGIPDFSSQPFLLSDVQFPKQRKPFYNDKISFNISHSGEMVCCVISSNIKVGIDIELQRRIPPTMLEKFLTESSDRSIASTEDDKLRFFDMWTRKEAIIKAADVGSIYNMSSISLEQQGGHYQNSFWHCYPVDIISADENDIKEKYTCHIACSDKINKINLKQIHEL